MQIAFSGSRRGPFPAQRSTLRRTLSGLLIIAQADTPDKEPPLFRHGDCLGWDAAAHDDADALGYGIIIHPPENPTVRAFKSALIILPPKPYLERNRDMADASTRAIICPETPHYRTRSGSWYTWKYARGRGLDVLLILPDGRVLLEVGRSPQKWPDTP